MGLESSNGGAEHRSFFKMEINHAGLATKLLKLNQLSNSHRASRDFQRIGVVLWQTKHGRCSGDCVDSSLGLALIREGLDTRGFERVTARLTLKTPRKLVSLPRSLSRNYVSSESKEAVRLVKGCTLGSANNGFRVA